MHKDKILNKKPIQTHGTLINLIMNFIIDITLLPTET